MPFYMVILHFTSLLADFFTSLFFFCVPFFDTLILLR